MILNRAATEIINRLENASFDAYAVGGAVRDILMGRTPHDFDVATNARSDEIKALFFDRVVIPTGEKHGTVTVLCGDESVEVTTFRVDGEYSDARHPSAVTFVGDIRDDLSRRDFTVNAIAYNDRCGLVDPFDGVGDIKRRVLRAVGDAEKRFSEDALRIMRCIRFASVLGFTIDRDTDEALKSTYMLLENVSAERIFIEFKLFLTGDFRDVLEGHQYIFKLLFPKWVMPSAFCLDGGCDGFTRMAYFFSNTDIQDVNAYLHSLRCDNATRRELLAVLAASRHSRISTQREALYFLNEYGYDTAKRAMKLQGDANGEKLIDEVSGLCYCLDRLAINGNDILSFGYRGSEIGEIKKRLLHAVIDGDIENERESLLKFLAQ